MLWDDVKYFLAVARFGQMRGAATRLGVSQATLSRRLNSLEKTMGCKLLERSTVGCTLTLDGAALLPIAEQIEENFIKAQNAVQPSDAAVSGTIRIGTTDGFGVLFLAPRLAELRKRHPLLEVELVPVPRSFSLSRREADMAVMVGRPQKGRLRAQKLTDYTLRLYAAHDYLNNYGRPKTVADLASHQLVGYVEDLIFTPHLNYAHEFLPGWHSEVAISSLVAQIEAVRTGSGIGILHDYMVQPHDKMECLFPDQMLTRAYWMAWHESMKGNALVGAVATFLSEQVKEAHLEFVAQQPA